MNPRKRSKDKDIESKVEEIEMDAEMEVVDEAPEEAAEEATFEVSAETEFVAETPEEVAEVGGVTEDEEQMDDKKVNLKTLASGLYQMGLDLGLAPDEAALLTSETKLPAFIGEEGVEEFKQGLVESYQEMLDERLHSLKQKLGVG